MPSLSSYKPSVTELPVNTSVPEDTGGGRPGAVSQAAPAGVDALRWSLASPAERQEMLRGAVSDEVHHADTGGATASSVDVLDERQPQEPGPKASTAAFERFKGELLGAQFKDRRMQSVESRKHDPKAEDDANGDPAGAGSSPGQRPVDAALLNRISQTVKRHQEQLQRQQQEGSVATGGTPSNSTAPAPATPAPSASGASSPAEQAKYDALIKDFQGRLTQAAQDPVAWNAMMKAVYGESFNQAAAEGLRQKALNGDFSWMPNIKLASPNDMKGAGGAYSAADNTIYLNSGLLMTDPALAAKVLAEEMGHAIDTIVNGTRDAKGDEGELFAMMLFGESISQAQMDRLKAENDHGTLTVDGKTMDVEFSNPVEKATDAIKGAVDAVVDGVKDLAKAVVDTVVKIAASVCDAMGIDGPVKDMITNAIKAMACAMTLDFEGVKDAVKDGWKATMKLVEKVLQSKIFNIILTIARFIPIPIVQLIVRIVDLVKAAYTLYQAIKNKSWSMALGAVATIAGQAAAFGTAMGASQGFIDGANTVKTWADNASLAHKVVAEKDFAAALQLIQNGAAATKGTGMGAALSSANASVNEVKATVDAVAKSDVVTALGTADTSYKMYRAVEKGDYGAAASLGAKIAGDENPNAKGTFEGLAKLDASYKSARKGDYAAMAGELAEGLNKTAAGGKNESLNVVSTTISSLQSVHDTSEAIRKGDYKTADDKAKGLAGQVVDTGSVECPITEVKLNIEGGFFGVKPKDEKAEDEKATEDKGDKSCPAPEATDKSGPPDGTTASTAPSSSTSAEPEPARVSAKAGDSISTLIGTSDPEAVGQFMRENNLTDSTIQEGESYRIPDRRNQPKDGTQSQADGQAGQAALNRDNQRVQGQQASQTQQDVQDQQEPRLAGGQAQSASGPSDTTNSGGADNRAQSLSAQATQRSRDADVLGAAAADASARGDMAAFKGYAEASNQAREEATQLEMAAEQAQPQDIWDKKRSEADQLDRTADDLGYKAAQSYASGDKATGDAYMAAVRDARQGALSARADSNPYEPADPFSQYTGTGEAQVGKPVTLPTYDEFSTAGHMALGAAGTIPVLGALPDTVDLIWTAAEMPFGKSNAVDLVLAATALGGTVLPGTGDVAAGMAKTAARTGEVVGDVKAAGRAENVGADVAAGASRGVDGVNGGVAVVDGAIPNATNAVIDPGKLTSYALNPAHPVGGNKAKVFDSALGFNSANADQLIAQIQQGARTNPAVLGKLDQFGQRFTVDMPITGPNGNTAMVRTGWILDPGSTTPRLTTTYVK